MTIHIHSEIEGLKQKILHIGTVVEQSLLNSIKALEKRDVQLARSIIENDADIDRMEVELEEDCLKVLALHQPVAIDLRFIVAMLKINSDLERIGDLAVNIAERAEYLASHEEALIRFDYREMAGKAGLMLEKSLDSLVTLDADLARDVCAADDEVDDMNRQMLNKVQDAVRENPGQMDLFLRYLLVARHLERVADHATNIAEDVIYMVQGEIVRHRLDEYPS